ncbi:hypothetical protein T4D_8670 [Trichinella pseudospiralis]|uniref:Uncharacterized protein n=1 Tax=Trichinella pseudospiralis TaxID=6337 RepID=A0A0V1G6Q3_TRIPS|nr:hypothetical protein T4D_8670 [Trichinella pseudospiralis]
MLPTIIVIKCTTSDKQIGTNTTRANTSLITVTFYLPQELFLTIVWQVVLRWPVLCTRLMQEAWAQSPHVGTSSLT